MADIAYGSSASTPALCFGFFFAQIDSLNFNYTLSYFDSIIKGSIQDIPSGLILSLDPFQKVPDMDSYTMWLNSGYLQMMKIINDVILKINTGKSSASIDFGVMAQKYTTYEVDPFGNFLGFLLPFFIVIAYLCPLCVLVFRMVSDKESKAKEGMKIMGLSETVYFFSYFLHWLVINTIYSFINSIILTRVLSHVRLQFIFGLLWLYGMCVFAMAYFFQSLMDKTRIAMIISILVYFIMFFISSAVLSDSVANSAKMFISLFPPTAIDIGISVLAKYEANGITFNSTNISTPYNNYSISNMYTMLFIDILVYLFLGFYLQNTVAHQFGMSRPFYFLCTTNFWCKKRKVNSELIEAVNYAKVNDRSAMSDHPVDNSEDYFQNENNYGEKIRSGDCLQIKNLKKVFDDGKVAVDGLNLNFYKGEIFALLGHNGAGKSTTISIMCGLYESTSGTAHYNGTNVLADEEMENFRKKLGICPQHDVLFEKLTVKEHLEMFCVFKGVQSDLIEGETEKILREVQLMDKFEEQAGSLSGGQKRKLSIAIALAGGSEVVFLDEPSSGMDITSRRNLWDILKKCVGNRIIVLTTHYMEEAAVLGKRIGIVSSGKLKCSGNGLFLIDKFGKYISLNVYKFPDARNDEIINFFKTKIQNVEYEILSEEILFRIPKSSTQGSFSFKAFSLILILILSA